MSINLRTLRVPAAMLALAAIILMPAYFVSAQDTQGAREGGCNPGPQPGRFHVSEVVEIDTNANTILAESRHPVRPREGEEGDVQTEYILISYDDETTFNQDAEEVEESAISVGDKIHARGNVNRDSDEYFAEIDADHVMLWDELEPRPPHDGQGRRVGPPGEQPPRDEGRFIQ